MITEITEELKERIVSYLEAVLTGRKILNEGEKAKVTVEIGPNRSVEVEIQSEKDDAAILQRVLNSMEFHRVRTESAFLNHNVTLDRIRRADFAEYALKLRNVGRQSLKDLARVLQKEGVECEWIQPFLTPSPGSPGMMALEIEKGTVREISSAEWDSMIEALYYPQTQHSITQESILMKLQDKENIPLSGAQAFPRKVPSNRRRPMLALINIRWKCRKLPFRVRYVSKPTGRNKFDGEVQVVVV